MTNKLWQASEMETTIASLRRGGRLWRERVHENIENQTEVVKNSEEMMPSYAIILSVDLRRFYCCWFSKFQHDGTWNFSMPLWTSGVILQFYANASIWFNLEAGIIHLTYPDMTWKSTTTTSTTTTTTSTTTTLSYMSAFEDQWNHQPSPNITNLFCCRLHGRSMAISNSTSSCQEPQPLWFGGFWGHMLKMSIDVWFREEFHRT